MHVSVMMARLLIRTISNLPLRSETDVFPFPATTNGSFFVMLCSRLRRYPQKDRTADELKKAQENAKAGAKAEAAAAKAAGKKK